MPRKESGNIALFHCCWYCCSWCKYDSRAISKARGFGTRGVSEGMREVGAPAAEEEGMRAIVGSGMNDHEGNAVWMLFGCIGTPLVQGWIFCEVTKDCKGSCTG